MSPIETRVINLKRRTDRKADICKRLKDAGISWQWHVATDALSIDPKDLRQNIGSQSRAYPFTHVEMACAQSHLNCWKNFLAGDGTALCVLEDDVHFSDDLPALLASSLWVTAAHGLIKLDVNSPKLRKILVSDSDLVTPAAHVKVLRLWSRRLGAGGYIAHRDIIAQLLSQFERPGIAIDHCLFNPPYAPHFKGFGVHILEPAPIFHDHSGSDIQDSRATQKKSGDWRWIKLARSIENTMAIPDRLRAMIVKKARFRPLDPARNEID
jgi:glycosyl transferase family 25